jgi:hypothetical protein
MDERTALVSFIESLDKLTLLCGLLVAIGVAGEFGIGYLHRAKSSRLREIEDGERTVAQAATSAMALQIASATRDVEVARSESAAASARAADANARAAEANAQAAESKRMAEGEKLERIRLQERIRPRSLTRPDMLASAVSPFPNEVLFIDCDNDQQPIAMQIISAVRSVGWTNVGWTWSEQIRVAPGMAVYFSAEASKRTADAAQALADGLRAAGVADLTGPTIGSASPGTDANSKITIRIGAKE